MPTRSKYHLYAAEADREGYYVTRWDLSTPITVNAISQQEAFNKAIVALGPARSGRRWVFKVKEIEVLD